jgi:hypothetical protein
MSDSSLTLCAIFRVPPAGVAAFQAYEQAVLPFLADHGGILQRRLRGAGGITEVHLIWFPSAARFDAYRADPRRSAHTALFEASGATAEVLVVGDVEI